MNERFVPVVAAAGIATMLGLLGACSDDDSSTPTGSESDSTTLASGSGVELVGEDDLGGQTLDVRAEERDGEVTGEFRFSDPGGQVVVTVECADTDTDGVVILGGTVAESTDPEISELAALFVKEGDPDRVAVWLDQGENPTCSDLLTNRHDVLDDDSLFVAVEAGSNIETG